MAAESAPRERMAWAIGTVQVAQRLGPAFGPVVGGLLAPLVGLRATFLVAAPFYLPRSCHRRRLPRAAHVPGAGCRTGLREVFRSWPVRRLLDGVRGDPRLAARRPQLRADPAALRRRLGVAGRVPRWRGCCSALRAGGRGGPSVAAPLLDRGTARTLIVGASLTAAAGLAAVRWTPSVWVFAVGDGVVQRRHRRCHDRGLRPAGRGCPRRARHRLRPDVDRLAHRPGDRARSSPVRRASRAASRFEADLGPATPRSPPPCGPVDGAK